MPFIEPVPTYSSVHPLKRGNMPPTVEVDMWGNLVQLDEAAQHVHYNRHRQFGSQPIIGRGDTWQGSPMPALHPSFQAPVMYDRYGMLPFHGEYQSGPGGWRAPVMEPRHVLLNECVPTPHDTFRYPASFVEPLTEPPSRDDVLQALAEWYVDQVVSFMVKPGCFRPGVGGSSEEIWGLRGRELAAWERVGRTAPDYSKPWGRMGMTATPVQPARRPRSRSPASAPHDPWNILWSNTPTRSTSLVHFVKDVLVRMSVDDTSVVAAVWFLGGLGLHESDGAKGSELRSLLRAASTTEVEAVEKRVAMLGLLLAGKWLDDNSFLNKSWTEVTGISVTQIYQLEVAALRDFHWALYIPLSAWVDHVNNLYSAFVYDEAARDTIVYTTLDDMVSQAREAELNDPRASTLAILDTSRRSSLDMTADHVLAREWGAFARSYSYDRHEVDFDKEQHRNVSALVDDERIDEDEEEEDEWALDYDGATRWLPSMSELRRSLSGSQSPEPLGRRREQEAGSHDRSSSFDYGLATPPFRQAPVKQSSVFYHRAPLGTPANYTYHENNVPQQAHWTPPDGLKVHHRPSMELEPGVTVVRPPLADVHRQDPPMRLTPHEQQMREAEEFSMDSAHGYFPRRPLRAST
ncbi:hypothetical protein BD324DRAFT_651321 [Kockovaella imperatae]|uniref:Uncharacterized protein n=1 Tax=Kockovaella imperatae TaxID=4999 RepID=A0A1Y1UFJ6_9TREE|nr:hypothetical protein BD324DRAFT_651321 [Kockovaella imperatae]ORX36840.1 hypothetical protein BD324DRAFT_651321 [Kockovaella imperatae]